MQKDEFVLLNSVGLRKIYERRLLRAQLANTRIQLENAQKIREVKIPYSLFDKKKQRSKVAVAGGSDPSQPLVMSLGRSRSVQAPTNNDARTVTIVYKDSVLPDDVYFSPDFQKVKLYSVVNNMNTVVHKFFRNKSDSQHRELVMRWLGSLEGMDGFEAGKLLTHLLDFFTLEKHTDRYIFWSGDRVHKVQILADGQVDLFSGGRIITHRSDGLVMNGEVVRFEDVHTTNCAAFAVGDVYLITLTLSDYLKACAKWMASVDM